MGRGWIVGNRYTKTYGVKRPSGQPFGIHVALPRRPIREQVDLHLRLLLIASRSGDDQPCTTSDQDEPLPLLRRVATEETSELRLLVRRADFAVFAVRTLRLRTRIQH